MQKLTFLIVTLFYSIVLTAQPFNDNLSNAVGVLSLPFTNTVTAADAAAATGETNEVICEGDEESWWYAFTPSTTAKYMITTEVTGVTSNSSSNDTRLGVYTGTAHPLTEVTCYDNDEGAGYGEEETLTLTASTTYYIRVTPKTPGSIQDVTTMIRAVNTWTGTTDSDWANTDNWDLGHAPTSDEVAWHPTSGNEASVLSGTTATPSRVVLEGGDLTIAQGGTLNIANSDRYGIRVNNSNSTLSVDGNVTVTSSTRGAIRAFAGIVQINSTADLTFTNCFLGMRFQSSSSHTIDGDVTIQNAEGGILLKEADVLTIGSSSTITMQNINNEGFYLDDENAKLNIEGMIDMDNIKDAFYIQEGTFELDGTVQINTATGVGMVMNSSAASMTINSSGVFNADGITDYGMLDVVCSNAGTINISNTGNDAINTCDATFTNTGSIFINTSSKDGIDCDDNFNNSGLVQIQNITELALNDATFNNLSGGTLRTDGTAEALNTTFASGSIIEPGVTIGCFTIDGAADISGTTLNIEINNTTQCTEHDKVLILGEATITNATLNISGSLVASGGESVTILEVTNTANPITGTFSGLTEGASIFLNGKEWTISYSGGDGNDIVLTAMSPLPVELLEFTATSEGTAVHLNWMTASEINNSHFDVEWSIDGWFRISKIRRNRRKWKYDGYRVLLLRT